MALYWHSPQILTDNKFIYLDISNLLYNYEKVNPSTNLKYDFVPGDRLRMIYYFNNPESSPESYSNKEYVVIAEVTNPTAGTGDYLTGFNVTNPGFGYTTPPTVNITGGGGSGASAHAVIGSGGVISIVLDVQGAGYTSSPDVTLTGGGGSGATAVAISGYFQGTFLKLNIDKDSYPAGDVIFKVYRPQQQVDTENTVFYEFGEQYPVIVVNGVHYHGGMLQNQGRTNRPPSSLQREICS